MICDSCRRALSDFGKDPENCSRELPPTPDYESLFVSQGPLTRSKSDPKCSCPICVIGRLNGQDYKQYAQAHSDERGRKKTSTATPPTQTLPLCPKCLSLIGRGVEHTCSKAQRRENLANFVRTSSGYTKDKVTSEGLKSLCEDKGVNPRSGGTLSLKTGGNNPFQVQVGKVNPALKRPLFTAESLKRLQNSENFSNRQTL